MQDDDIDLELEQTGEPDTGGLDFVFDGGDGDEDEDAPPALSGDDFALAGGAMLGDELQMGGQGGDDGQDEEEEEEEDDGDDSDAL